MTGCYVWPFNFHFMNEFSILNAFLNIWNVSSVLYSDSIFLPLWWNSWRSCSSFTFLWAWCSDCCHVKWQVFPDVFWLLWHNSRKLLESECYLSGLVVTQPCLKHGQRQGGKHQPSVADIFGSLVRRCINKTCTLKAFFLYPEVLSAGLFYCLWKSLRI